jgi:hypothetical protein
MPEPVAYYWFNEGSGTKMKEAVSGVVDAGYVDYEVADQPNGAYPGETWVVDPNFGNVFQCGNAETMAKDVLRLADVDYGSIGKWTINVWVRNPVGTDFPDREREQLFGHGDAQEITNAPNQIHIQLENLHLPTGGEISTIVGDGNDYQSCVKENVVTAAQLAGTNTKDADGNLLNPGRETVEQLTGMDVFPATTCPALWVDLQAEGVNVDDVLAKCLVNGTTNEVQACNRIGRARTIKSRFFSEEEPPKELGTVGITNDDWHMITLTTHPDGSKGFNQYLNGVLRATSPMQAGVGYDPGYATGPKNGGDPIDPVGPIRFCGREKPGDWSGEAGARFDEERYCNLELAHFSVYSDAMTATQVEELRQEYFKAFFPERVEGYSSQAGACRGPGGDNDKVSSKYKQSVTLADCAKECNDNAGRCKGFAYSPTANSGECLIYGPDFSGSCSDATAKSPAACAALGTCSNADQVSEETCGSCSATSATSEATCDQVGGTWTKATWTSKGATWTEPTGGWTGDYHSSNLVVGVVASAGYTCYDVDPYDHHPKCEGNVAAVDESSYLCTEADVANDVKGCGSTTDYQCDTATCGTSNCGSDCNGCAKGCAYCTEVCGVFSGPCHHEFMGKTMAEKTSDLCPTGCTFTAAVTAAKVVVTHSKAEQYDGWTHMAGVCRSDTPAGGDMAAKPNGRYSKTAGANGGPATQKECKDHCAAHDDCIGYAHADNSWCLNYGPGLNITDSVWSADYHPATTITQTKVNPAYICGVKDDKTAEVVTDAATTTEPDKVEQSACRYGAMTALALGLTTLWQ